MYLFNTKTNEACSHVSSKYGYAFIYHIWLQQFYSNINTEVL